MGPLTRRQAFAAGAAGIAGAGLLGAAAAGNLHDDARRFRDWIERRPDPFVPNAPEGRWSVETVHSAARGRDVDLFTAVPHGYGTGAWTDSAVRRYVADAGPLLPRLHQLTRSDCTTRNRRKAAALSASYDDLEARIARLREREELDAIRPDLDGNAIMELLGVPPGPVVGRAWAFLKELRLEQGPLDREAAEAALLQWWSTQPESTT